MLYHDFPLPELRPLKAPASPVFFLCRAEIEKIGNRQQKADPLKRQIVKINQAVFAQSDTDSPDDRKEKAETKMNPEDYFSAFHFSAPHPSISCMEEKVNSLIKYS